MTTTKTRSRLVEQYDLHDSACTSYHYMVADATGASAVLEWVNGTDATDNDGSARRLNVIYNSGDTQCVTNFVLTPGYYDAEEDKAGADRYACLEDALAACGGMVADEDAAMELLNKVSRRDWGNQGDSNSLTVHSVVYNLTDRTSRWVGNEHYGEADRCLHYQVK